MNTPFDSKVRQIFTLLRDHGAREVLVVGGFVRDWLLHKESKDIDLEVYGLDYSQIAGILSEHFHVNPVGQSFGVLKIDNRIDVALPRRESKFGQGHKGFEVESSPNLSYEEAFARRDFTINAIGMREDGTLVDPYGGQSDLCQGILRATSAAFKDDPLRVLRGMQFAARFGFTMDEQTIGYCREVSSEFSTLSQERIFEEWKKWCLRGIWPSRGLRILKDTGWLEHFPELAAMVGCKQNPRWHPEGDVWEHTMRVCDEMAEILRDTSEEHPYQEEERLVLMFAALLHDVGKPRTTELGEDGQWHSKGHSTEGVPLVRTFLENMRSPIRLIEQVEPLVREHMTILLSNDDSIPSPRSVRRLACRLWPANIRLWSALCTSDGMGCFPADVPRSERSLRFRKELWLSIAEKIRVLEERPVPLVMGRDLISLGISSGPEMGKMLDRAYDAQLEGTFATCEDGLIWLGLNPNDRKIIK